MLAACSAGSRRGGERHDFQSRTRLDRIDGPPPLAATLGPEGVAEFLRKGAGLINQVEQSVLKRLPDLSY